MNLAKYYYMTYIYVLQEQIENKHYTQIYRMLFDISYSYWIPYPPSSLDLDKQEIFSCLIFKYLSLITVSESVLHFHYIKMKNLKIWYLRVSIVKFHTSEVKNFSNFILCI